MVHKRGDYDSHQKSASLPVGNSHRNISTWERIMVFKVKSNGVSGDLNNPFDNYGYFDETVLILGGTPGTSIRTYESNDYIFGG